MDKAVMSVRMQKWAGIIQEAATSGLTKTEFCARKGIDRRQFFHWQKQIREYVLENNPELGLPAPPHGQMPPDSGSQLTDHAGTSCLL